MDRRWTCPTPGVLRAVLDGTQEAVSPALGEHVRQCARCQRVLHQLEAAAEVARRVTELAAPDDVADPALAYQRWQQRVDAARTDQLAERHESQGGRPMRIVEQFRVRLAAVGVVAVALLALLVAVTPLGAVADEFVNRFRVQQFAAITVPMDMVSSFATQADMISPEQRDQLHQELERLAQFTTTFQEGSVRTVDSLDEAAGVLGREPATPGHLPEPLAGVVPRFMVGDAGTTAVTIDVARAQTFLEGIGLHFASLPDPVVSPTVTVTLHVPASVAQVYERGDRTLVVGEMDSPELILPETIDPELLREDLLSLPGLPPDLVAQIRAVRDWRETLIIPVPADAITRQVTLHGVSGLLIESPQDGTAVVLWQKDGVLHAVGGTFDGETVLAVAESVR